MANDANGSPTLELHDLLGLQLAEAGPERVVVTWTVDSRHLQPFGLAHGGLHCLVNESAASIAGALWFGDEGTVVGIHNSTDFLRAARPGDSLRAIATPVHRGRTQQLWLIETRDAAERLVARGQVRLQNLPRRG